MHNDEGLVIKRIERELWERVLPQMYSETVPLQIEAWDAPGEPVAFAEAVAQEFRPFAVGESWSRPWGTTWFRLIGEVPDGWSAADVELVVDLGFRAGGPGFQAEGLVWHQGEPLQGVHPRRTAVPLPDAAGPFEVYVEAASNPALGPGYRPSSMGSLATSGHRSIYRLQRAELALLDRSVYHLILDIEVLLGVAVGSPVTDPRRRRVIRQLEAAFNTLDMGDVAGTAAAARALLAPALAMSARSSSMQVVGVGHAHIDSAWLWPIRETIRKCARTFASATRLMDDDPSYRFVCSQAAQYDWMEQHYPALFERIAERVARGQFVPVGGMWVEADMNLPSGESILRQIVHGQRYFESRFGRRCSEVWIPDVFGYPASLPQMFAAGGFSRFITQKLSWNKQNRFPHNTFWWEGIDGTKVLTHFPPVDTYNAEVVADEMMFSERNFQDSGWSDWALMPYGYGNGGGGPTREMLERARRMADLDGVPRLTLGTPDEFFSAVEAEAEAGSPVPVWRGELYFEMHRGTLTSQIETKVGNRRCERLLGEAELWWACVGETPGELDRLWKDTLLQQFHDILPGSSIAWVHADAEAEHRRIAARLEELIDEAFDRLGVAGTSIANATSFRRREVIDVADRPTMVEVDGLSITPGGVAIVSSTEDRAVIDNDGRGMGNAVVSIRWNDRGELESLYDKRALREAIPPGRPVAIELAPDHPVEYDAWDTESWTALLGSPLRGEARIEVVESGPLRSRVRVTRRFGASSLAVTFVLRSESARVDLEFDIDWREDESLLSLVVPLDIRADTARCGIQFGHVRRPTHPSSPWDAAKFEVCAHGWVDLSERRFGVAVLNDGRYGHRLFDAAVRVSLLKAAKFPDPSADRGHHRTTISLLPHGGDPELVVREADALRNPLRLVSRPGSGAGGQVVAPISVGGDGVGVSAVKLADDGSGDVIVRLFEQHGERTVATLASRHVIRSAARCTALEEISEALVSQDGALHLALRPFELVTLRLGLGHIAV